MSKSVGKIFGSSSASPYGYEKNYLNYLELKILLLKLRGRIRIKIMILK